MAKQTARIEIRKTYDDILPLFLASMKSLKTLRTPSKLKIPATKSKTNIHELPVKMYSPLPTRVFLYIKLEHITNLPPTESDLTLDLRHSKGSIHKLTEHYTTDTCIHLDLYETEHPTFSITIDQDSVEDLNCFSDNPLLVTVYEDVITEPDEASEGNAEGEEKEPLIVRRQLAQGFIDLMQFFTSTRSYACIQTYLYPLPTGDIHELRATTNTTWQVYTLLPLLKNLSFCNMAFISLESIYNVRPELMEDCGNLVVELSFQSRLPNEEQKFEKNKICCFHYFSKDIILQQNGNQKWETIKDVELDNANALGVYTGCYLNLHRLFNKLLGTEGVDFNIEEINIHEDYALVCNSVHRFILTPEMVRMLEDIVAFNEQELLVEVYRSETPEEILLHGTIDLSIFLYPRINSIRFAVELLPADAAPGGTAGAAASTESPPKSKKRRSGGSTAGDSKRTSPERKSRTTAKKKPTFAIISICLQLPITDSIETLVSMNANPMRRNQLKRCLKVKVPQHIAERSEICEDYYRQFDEHISMLITYILQNQIKSTMEAKKFFCCQLENLVNKVMKLIACDFNVRFPTKTNIEFTNLMTVVYKELVQRMYNILHNSNNNNLVNSFKPNPENIEKILKYMETIKYSYESGNTDMGKFLFEKLKRKNPDDSNLNYFVFLYDVEKHDFEAARKYQALPLKQKLLDGEYFSQLIKIYMDYMDQLSDVEKSLDSMENLLETLRDFTFVYRVDVEAYVLLYCLYKQCRYLPGMSFTRWKFENFTTAPRKPLPAMPRSLWQMHNNYKPTFKTQRGTLFYSVAENFMQLGMYKFAEIVYEEVARESTDAEKYFILTTLKILLKDVDKKYAAKTFPADKLINGAEIKSFNAQINGNLDYFRESTDAAMKNYANILNIKDLEDFENFKLSMLRYGHNMMQAHEYKRAVDAYEKCCLEGSNCLVPNFEMGKACYRLNRLEDAEKYFATATSFGMHIPDMWAFLALVNLKMGQNFKALECWKYAKLNPRNVIAEEILSELSKIKCDDVFLYVETP